MWKKRVTDSLHAETFKPEQYSIMNNLWDRSSGGIVWRSTKMPGSFIKEWWKTVFEKYNALWYRKWKI